MFNMGTITVNVDDKTEMLFRNAVGKEVGTGKGKLGSAITEALKNWAREKGQDEITKRQIRLLKSGFSMGGFKFDRDNIHDRSN